MHPMTPSLSPPPLSPPPPLTPPLTPLPPLLPPPPSPLPPSLLQVSPCHDFLKDLLGALLAKSQSSLLAADKQLKEPYTAPGYTEPPQRRADVNFTRYSWVLQHNLTCYPTSPCQYRMPSDCPTGESLPLTTTAAASLFVSHHAALMV